MMKPVLNLRFLLALAVAGIAAYAVYASFFWPLRAGLFPRVIGGPLFVLAVVEMLWSAFKPEREREGHAVDFELAANVDPAVARKRTAAISLWIVGFFVLIFLLGFSIAVPLFVFLYLKLAGREGWVLSATLTLGAWLFIETIFNRLLHLPLPAGWLLSLWS
jgi:hypothetical protein